MSSCNAAAISISKRDGFAYPLVDDEKCISCGDCIKVCPVINNRSLRSACNLNYYMAWHKDPAIVSKSSSGGLFSAAAEHILGEGGIVCGASYTDDFKGIVHVIAENEDQLGKLRGSKYAQSSKEHIYMALESALTENPKLKVLYTGTPCDVAGCKSFLIRKKLFHDGIIFCDVICHGVTSADLLSEFIGNLEKSYASKVIEFSMRNKRFGWNFVSLYFKMSNKVCKTYSMPSTNFGYAFEVFSRPSCYKCFFKGENRASDFTIGDYWSILEQDRIKYNKNGTSVAISNTENGDAFLKSLKHLNLSDAREHYINHQHYSLNNSKRISPRRESFKDLISKYGLQKAVSAQKPMKRKIRALIPMSIKASVSRMLLKLKRR